MRNKSFIAKKIIGIRSIAYHCLSSNILGNLINVLLFGLFWCFWIEEQSPRSIYNVQRNPILAHETWSGWKRVFEFKEGWNPKLNFLPHLFTSPLSINPESDLWISNIFCLEETVFSYPNSHKHARVIPFINPMHVTVIEMPLKWCKLLRGCNRKPRSLELSLSRFFRIPKHYLCLVPWSFFEFFVSKPHASHKQGKCFITNNDYAIWPTWKETWK